jgi:tRNA(Arg) A34 adenosine deaminase TadA
VIAPTEKEMGVRLVREAAIRAVDLAEAAAALGTFGVGGVLLGPGFEPLHECRNRVVKEGHTADPTAHVERQFIDWYFAARRQGIKLPPPRQCTIISSLDPCMQCTGAILAAGFRCLAIAPDSMAGVHYAGWESLNTLPQELRGAAVRSLGCFAVSGKRGYVGPEDPILSSTELDKSLLARSENALLGSLDTAQGVVAASGLERPFSHAAVRELQAEGNDVRIEALASAEPGTVHKLMLRMAPPKDGKASDVACFVDHKNAIAVFAQGRTENSPIRTAIMQLVRGYAELRWKAVRKRRPAPSHPKDCILYTFEGPGCDPLGVMAIGAVGSTLEGPVSQPQSYWRSFRATQSPAELSAMLAAFPPLYRDVIRIHPVLCYAPTD